MAVEGFFVLDCYSCHIFTFASVLMHTIRAVLYTAMTFFRTTVISFCDNPTMLLKYSSTPPYFSLNKLRKAIIVSCLTRASALLRFQLQKNMTNRQVNMFSIASLSVANIGSLASRAITIARAGSRPTRVRA